MVENQKFDQQIKSLLAELNLADLSESQRGETVEMLRQRFSEVIFNTTVRLLPEELKAPYIQACMDPEKNSEQIIEITSQVPELAEGLEAALLYEYESLKHSMAK